MISVIFELVVLILEAFLNLKVIGAGIQIEILLCMECAMCSQSNECEIDSDIAAVGDKNNQVVLAKYQAAQNKR